MTGRRDRFLSLTIDRAGRLRFLVREHWGVVLVLVAGALIRVAVDMAQGPAVYQDSLVYISLSEDAPFRFFATRPNGYPVVMRVLSIGGGGLDVVTMAQHAGGLIVGLLVYALLVRLGVRRWIATATTACIVVDAYAVGLEQAVLSDSTFALAIVASAYMLLATKPRASNVAISGLLLAAAVTIRVVGLFAVPFWIGYVVVTFRAWRIATAGALAIATPLLAYRAFHAAHGQGFGFAAGDGWYLYGKVGPIVDCSGAQIPDRTRPLCNGPRRRPPEFYLYDRASPAQVLFFGPTDPVNVDEQWNHSNSALLRSFSLGIIRAHPLEFGQVVAKDFFRYLGPNPPAVEMTLYGKPGTLTGSYERWLHLPWWVVTGSALVALGSLIRARPEARFRETTFLLGMSLSLLVGASATAGFNPRYLVPLAPLILAAGALGMDDLLGRRPVTAPPPETDQLSLPI